MEEKLPELNNYVELILSIGIERMLQDVLPKDELLIGTVTAMFRKNWRNKNG